MIIVGSQSRNNNDKKLEEWNKEKACLLYTSKDLLALIKYIADEDKLEKVLENPQVIKTPVVRNGKQSTLGYQPDVWKTWK